MIRHAQSKPSTDCHYSEWPLSPIGKRQAEALADLLKRLEIRKVFSSPFLRCLQTVKPYLKKTGIVVDIREDLRERLVSTEILDGFNEIWKRSWEDFDFSLPGCESSAEAQDRFFREVNRLAELNHGDTIAISSHGNVIGLFLNSIDRKCGIDEAEEIMNPDVLRITRNNGVFQWDREFRLHGIETIATMHNETTFEK